MLLVHALASIDRHRDGLCARARFDDHGYHRELIDRADGHELWLLSWLPGQATTIHDHAGAAGACEILSGRLLEERFARRADRVARTWTTVHTAGAIDVVRNDVIHRVRALAPTISLHLYIPGARDGQTYTELA